MPKQVITESFIENAKLVHGDKYDYTNTIYLGSHEKVTIICPIHGEFSQLATNHLRGKGCPYCAKRAKHTTSEFIAEAIKVHGKKYDYSKVEYKGYDEPVDIICPTHGLFKQSWNNHIRSGQECPMCAHRSRPYTTEEFVARAKEIHGDKYGYDNVEYETERKEIDILCKKHGLFKQKPVDHLRGCGCSKCNESKLEIRIGELLREIGIEYIPQKTFSWLGLQSLDFYLPQLNIAIECQGEQHYKEMFFNRHYANGLQHTKELDIIKQQKCNDHGITILYYSKEKYADEIFTDVKELELELIRLKEHIC